MQYDDLIAPAFGKIMAELKAIIESIPGIIVKLTSYKKIPVYTGIVSKTPN